MEEDNESMDEEEILADLQLANMWLLQKLPKHQVTPVLLTRFLTGLTQPVFTKLKARQQPLFGKYEELSYLAIKHLAQSL